MIAQAHCRYRSRQPDQRKNLLIGSLSGREYNAAGYKVNARNRIPFPIILLLTEVEA
jgi:hypothetical protein